MGRAFCVWSRRHHAGDQRFNRLRSPPLPPGHRGKQGPCGDAREAGHYLTRRCPGDRARSRHDPVRDGNGQVPLQAGARRHPYERRVAACGADRAFGRASAYGAFAQRPDRDRLQALGARRDRRHRRGAGRLSNGARREGAGAGRDRHAGLHAPADRAAGDVRASSAGVCGDGGARSRPLRRCAQAPERKPARRGGARRHLLPARPRDDREGARLRPPGREFARRGVRPRLRDGSARRSLDHGGAPVALCRRDRAVVLAARRFRDAHGQIHHRLIDHAAEAQSGRGRAGARQDGTHRRRAAWAS